MKNKTQPYLAGRFFDSISSGLFMMALPVFTFLFSPLLSITSRKNEFEADAFAATHSNSQDLISALGPALAQTLFDGGLRRSLSDQAIASYDASVATYRLYVAAPRTVLGSESTPLHFQLTDLKTGSNAGYVSVFLGPKK